MLFASDTNWEGLATFLGAVGAFIVTIISLLRSGKDRGTLNSIETKVNGHTSHAVRRADEAEATLAAMTEAHTTTLQEQVAALTAELRQRNELDRRTQERDTPPRRARDRKHKKPKP